MPWTAPSESLILAQFTPGEAASIQAIQGATDNLPGILTLAVNEVRGAILSGSYDVLADATTIPDALHNDCIALARWNYLIAMPQLAKLQTDKRKEAYDEAKAKLKLISTQQWKPESPTAALTTPAGRWNSNNKLIMRTDPTPDAASQYPNPDYANPAAPTNT